VSLRKNVEGVRLSEQKLKGLEGTMGYPLREGRSILDKGTSKAGDKRMRWWQQWA